MDIQILRAEMEDAEVLAELFIRYSHELTQFEMVYSLQEDSVLPAMSGRIRSKLALPAIAKVDSKIVGFLFCNISRLSGYTYDDSPLFGYIADTFVEPEYRKHGIAKKLCDFALSWLRENDVKYVELKVLESNASAHRFWSSCGFTPTTKTYGKPISERG